MMVLFGERLAGRIDGHEGQYGCTRFFHIFFLPLIPTASFWVISEKRDEAHEIRYGFRSVVSGYLRTWLPALTIGQLYFGGTPGLVTLGLLGLAGATGSWWNLRGRKRKLIASMSARALGSACPLRLLSDGAARAKLAEAEALWSERVSDRSLQDTARFGAESKDEAALAETILRLRLRVKRGDADENESWANAILEGAQEVSALEMGGPMRSRLTEAAVPEDDNT